MYLPEIPGDKLSPSNELIQFNLQKFVSPSLNLANARPALCGNISQEQCRDIYDTRLCRQPVLCSLGYKVHFRRKRFDHAFFKTQLGKPRKGEFDAIRAERIDWIPAILTDPNATVRVGYHKPGNCYVEDRRVFLWEYERYLVVIRIRPTMHAEFVTAYRMDGRNAEKQVLNIIRSPTAPELLPKGNGYTMSAG